MSLRSAITGKSGKPTGRQRRTAEIRRTDRAGQAAMDRYPSNRSTTAWHNDPPRRGWLRSS